jgi:hypothetical protein
MIVRGGSKRHCTVGFIGARVFSFSHQPIVAIAVEFEGVGISEYRDNGNGSTVTYEEVSVSSETSVQCSSLVTSLFLDYGLYSLITVFFP